MIAWYEKLWEFPSIDFESDFTFETQKSDVELREIAQAYVCKSNWMRRNFALPGLQKTIGNMTDRGFEGDFNAVQFDGATPDRELKISAAFTGQGKISVHLTGFDIWNDAELLQRRNFHLRLCCIISSGIFILCAGILAFQGQLWAIPLLILGIAFPLAIPFFLNRLAARFYLADIVQFKCRLIEKFVEETQ